MGSFTFDKQPFNQWNRLSDLSMCPLLRIRVHNIWGFTLLLWKCGSLLEKLMRSCFRTAKFSDRKGEKCFLSQMQHVLDGEIPHFSPKQEEESIVLSIKGIQMFTQTT